ncbi:MAG: amino acid adenylation domain-containing protein [Eubacterium sp.]|nr:amino acid adenylation domain-containing protein [Eubacterium sp.]
MKNVLEYLEKTAKRLPDKLAVTDGEEACTFEELRSNSARIGKLLSEFVSPGKPVAVMMKKSTKTLQIFLGTVYAGGFYCLLDPDFPDERHKSQLSTLSPQVIVAEPQTLEKIQRLGFKGKVIVTDQLFDRIKDIQEMPPVSDIVMDETEASASPTIYGASQPLYCNFTSGSTGVPKGVLVGHASVISFIDTFTELFGISENDVIGNQAPFDFDVSVKDIYSCLKTGATMVIIPTAFFRFPNNVMDMLEKYQVTTLTWAVSALVLLNRLHEFMYKVPPHINKVLFSGEEMPAKHLKDWMAQYPDAEFVNLYGPTEITCNCSYYRIDPTDVPEKLPIGCVFPGKIIYLIDENGRIIPDSENKTIGEICVGGNELALGYYNNEEATAKAFVNIDGIGRIYKTGDLGYRDGGKLIFAGRRDFQIKHNGHRIELEEVERAMNSLPGIGQACCIYDSAKYRIIVYYTGNEAPDRKAIVAGLKTKLPEYMLPNVYKFMDELPLSKNGKIDRNKLRELSQAK